MCAHWDCCITHLKWLQESTCVVDQRQDTLLTCYNHKPAETVKKVSYPSVSHIHSSKQKGRYRKQSSVAEHSSGMVTICWSAWKRFKCLNKNWTNYIMWKLSYSKESYLCRSGTDHREATDLHAPGIAIWFLSCSYRACLAVEHHQLVVEGHKAKKTYGCQKHLKWFSWKSGFTIISNL